MKSYLLPFVLALVGSALGFLLLDVAVMRLMGLTLLFHP